MAIGAIQGAMHYDINRDMYGGYGAQERYEYEKAMHYRRQEDEYRRAQQQTNHNSFALQVGVEGYVAGIRPQIIDPNDPLSFLSKADNNILRTGEAT
jgi:hypothetical protein